MAHPGGRPTKFTPKVQETLTKFIELGATYEDACACAGITYRTFRNWMSQGQQESEPGQESGKFFKFFQAIKRAEGRLVFRLMAQIEAAATDDWKAAAWKLERRYPDRYGRIVQDQRVSGHMKVEHDNLAQSILSNPTASKAATRLVAELAGTPQSEEVAAGR